MIFDAIVSFLMTVLNGVLALIPSYAPDFTGLGSGLGSSAAGLASFFPVATLAYCIAAVMGLRLFLLTLTLVTWVWAKVPFTFK